MAKLPLVLQLDALAIGSLLGEGAQGRVLAVTEVSDEPGPAVVLKCFHPTTLVEPRGVTRLVAWRRSLSIADRRELDRRTAWPLAVVADGDRIAGLLLPLVGDEFRLTLRLPSGRTRQMLSEAQYLIASGAALERVGITDTSVEDRLVILYELATTVAFLHRLGVVVGDLSTKNVLWAVEPPRVLLVDCDGMRFVGSEPAVPQLNSPGWSDPAFPATQNDHSDVYKLVLFVLRVLERDFQTMRIDSTSGAVPDALRPILEASLGTPSLRPSAGLWAATLRSIVRRSPEQQH